MIERLRILNVREGGRRLQCLLVEQNYDHALHSAKKPAAETVSTQDPFRRIQHLRYKTRGAVLNGDRPTTRGMTAYLRYSRPHNHPWCETVCWVVG